jgi:hypothetical protein
MTYFLCIGLSMIISALLFLLVLVTCTDLFDYAPSDCNQECNQGRGCNCGKTAEDSA